MSKSISVIEASNLYRELHKHFLLMKALKDPSGYFCLVLSALKNVIYRQASLFRMLVYRLSLNYVFRTDPFNKKSNILLLLL